MKSHLVAKNCLRSESAPLNLSKAFLFFVKVQTACLMLLKLTCSFVIECLITWKHIFHNKVECAKLCALHAKNMLACQRALHAYVLICLVCLLAHEPTCFVCLHAQVLRALCAYVLTSQRALCAYLLMCQCALCAYLLTCLACLCAHVPMCLSAYVLTCLACLHAYV